MKVKINETVTVNENEVLNKWQENFSNLYCIPDNVEYDDVFKQQKVYEKSLLEKDSYIIVSTTLSRA